MDVFDDPRMSGARGRMRRAEVQGLWDMGEPRTPRVPRSVAGNSDAASGHDGSRDFGGLAHVQPLDVTRPETVGDVVDVVRWAVEQRTPLVARGAGHSQNGQPLICDGVVVDMTALDAGSQVVGTTVTVSAGTTWRGVLDATVPAGLTPPVLTDLIDVTVGGTISAGGLGGTSYRSGAQTDNVIALDVVTSTGEVVTCAADRHADLFDAVRGGFGQVGIIVRATLPLVPVPRYVRVFWLRYPDRAAYTDDLRRLTQQQRFAYVEGWGNYDQAGRPAFLIEAAHFSDTADEVPDDDLLDGLHGELDTAQTLTYVQFADRLAPAIQARRDSGDWAGAHPWLNVLVPDDAVDALLDEAFAELDVNHLGGDGLITAYPLRTDRLRTPLFRTPASDLTWLVSTLTAGPHSPDELLRITAINRRLFDRARTAGGCLYPIGGPTLSPAEWQQHYGPQWRSLQLAKARWDPSGTFKPVTTAQ